MISTESFESLKEQECKVFMLHVTQIELSLIQVHVRRLNFLMIGIHC